MLRLVSSGVVEPEVFKIQRLSNCHTVIAYNKDYSKYMELPNTPELATFIGTKPRIYVKAKIVDGIFDIVETVENQRW